MSITLPLLAFNDVYRVNQRFVPQPGSPETSAGGTISVSQFGQLVDDIRATWAPRNAAGQRGEASGGQRQDGQDNDRRDEREGLVLFAGDVFNPSVESSVTRGSHMVS
ncbi:hypothetical protein Q5752_004322 [Cryptotrichosporon argae]